ncbi:MAG: hypothetical protein ACRCXC_06895 [Legionella sp.]
MASQIITNLEASEPRIKSLCDNLNVLEYELSSVNSGVAFDVTVEKLIDEIKTVHRFLSSLTNNAEQEVMSKVMAQIATEDNYKNAVRLFNYMTSATKSIHEAKERLSLNEVLVNLDESQRLEAMNYINALKELKPIADLLGKHVLLCRELLAQVNSEEELNVLEARIKNRGFEIENAFKQLMRYPQDEVVAEKLIEFLKINPHLIDIAQYSDIYEFLMDDILAARARLVADNGDDSTWASLSR